MNAKNLIKKLIKEEMDKSWQFTTPLKSQYIDIFVDKSKYPDQDIENGEATIVWEADIEARSWGIKYINPIITAVRVLYTINDPETMRPIKEKEIEWSVSNPQGYNVEEGTRSEGGQLVPSNVTLDERNKKIVVDF